jgi:YidC/Oxa1 family membrane protein insertase
MQRLQPQLQELQNKYKDKPEELQKALMTFYKENQYNPFSGCLPMLIQLPFIFALYAALISPDFAKSVAGQAFFFIPDLARKGLWSAGVPHWDSILMLIIFGVSTFISQKMMTTNPDDPTQKQMLLTMPLMITAMFAFVPVPAGVLLYLVFSNLITLGQNYVLLQWSPALHAAAPEKPEEPPQQPTKNTKKGK